MKVAVKENVCVRVGVAVTERTTLRDAVGDGLRTWVAVRVLVGVAVSVRVGEEPVAVEVQLGDLRLGVTVWVRLPTTVGEGLALTDRGDRVWLGVRVREGLPVRDTVRVAPGVGVGEGEGVGGEADREALVRDRVGEREPELGVRVRDAVDRVALVERVAVRVEREALRGEAVRETVERENPVRLGLRVTLALGVQVADREGDGGDRVRLWVRVWDADRVAVWGGVRDGLPVEVSVEREGVAGLTDGVPEGELDGEREALAEREPGDRDGLAEMVAVAEALVRLPDRVPVTDGVKVERVGVTVPRLRVRVGPLGVPVAV